MVYSKPCLARAGTVVDYLGRYSHRTAVSDGRLLSFDGDSVELSYKDYADGNRRKVMTLSGDELLRRFLLHVLPKGFMRVRHFGFLANRCRAKRLGQIRTALAAPPPLCRKTKTEPAAYAGHPCPKCRKGQLHVSAHLAPARRDPG